MWNSWISDIVILNDYAHVTGGAGQVALSAAAALARAGVRVSLLAAVGPVSEDLISAGVRVELTDQHDIRSDPARIRAAAQGVWNFRAARRMQNVLSKCDPDKTLVHVHGWSKAISSSAVHAAAEMDVSVVITLHDYFYACPNGGFFNFQNRKVCSLRPLSVACLREHCDRDGYSHKLWRSARQCVQNNAGFRSDKLRHFISLSNLNELVLRPFLPKDAAVYRVPNPIDVVKREPVNVAENSLFISVGRLSAEKGLTLFAKAAADLRCTALFVGEGESRSEIAEANAKAAITGWQSRNQVADHFRSARALVFPSLWYEAQPLVVLEAAAFGIPAIVPDRCAASELVDPGVTGLWFRSGELSDLRARIDTLRDGEAAARMGRAAYDRYWKDPFTMERHLASLAGCYRSVLRSRSNTHPASHAGLIEDRLV